MLHTRGQLLHISPRQMIKVLTTRLMFSFPNRAVALYRATSLALPQPFKMKYNVFICLQRHTLSLQTLSKCKGMIMLCSRVVPTSGTSSPVDINHDCRRQRQQRDPQIIICCSHSGPALSSLCLFLRQSQHLLGPALITHKHFGRCFYQVYQC